MFKYCILSFQNLRLYKVILYAYNNVSKLFYKNKFTYYKYEFFEFLTNLSILRMLTFKKGNMKKLLAISIFKIRKGGGGGSTKPPPPAPPDDDDPA